MKETFTKTGERLTGRLYELYTGDCPPQRPCTPEEVRQYRERMDSDKPAPLLDFMAAMAKEGAYRVAGGRPPDEAEKAERRRLCNGCSHRDAASDSCLICRCYLSARLLPLPPVPMGKIDCATQKCPKNLWGYAAGYQPEPQEKCCGGDKKQPPAVD